jgi:hypothetical protein
MAMCAYSPQGARVHRPLPPLETRAIVPPEAARTLERPRGECHPEECHMVYLRTFYTDLNGLICKMFKAVTST